MIKIFHISIFVFGLVFSSVDGCAQMTTLQMDNYKKLDKNKQKRMKTKGPILRTNKGKSKSVKKFGGGKSRFAKKRFKVGYILESREEDLFPTT